MCQQIKNNYLRKDKQNQEIFDLCLSMANGLGKEIFINQSKALATRKDYKSTLKNIKVPSLIICGEYDRLCPIKVHMEMESLIENSTLEIIPDAAHLPTLEQPAYLNKILCKWLIQ
jgi:pimeloyl-ACP methyl ester carboxylesterase